MNKSRTYHAKMNMIFAILLQVVTFVRGLILPQMIIPKYGSEVNGLISSITQFLAYISLLEAGVGSIFRVSLYKPLAERDMEKVSGVINEQKRFYRKIGMIFVFYAIILCFTYPMFAKTNISKGFIVSCVVILSINTFVEYFFSLPYVSLLSADQMVRITNMVSIVYSLVNIAVVVFCVNIDADIRVIYLAMCVIGLLRPLFYTLYVKKHYQLNKSVKPDEMALKQRWNGMVHHFAYYIHTNTDMAILTLFISTSMVSVYYVYSAIILGVEKIITIVSNAVAAGIGNLLASGDEERIQKTVDMFELVQGGLTTIVYTITALLLLPFIRLYTVNMSDMDYYQPVFGYLFIIAEAIYCFRCIYSTISTNANKFKETQLGAILECVTNLGISFVLVLVTDMGIVGIVIGTALGMFVRYLFEIIFLSKDVVFRSIWKPVKMLFVSIVVAVVSLVLCSYIFDYSVIDSMIMWMGYACATGIVVAMVACAVYTVFYKEIVVAVLHRFFTRRR